MERARRSLQAERRVFAAGPHFRVDDTRAARSTSQLSLACSTAASMVRISTAAPRCATLPQAAAASSSSWCKHRIWDKMQCHAMPGVVVASPHVASPRGGLGGGRRFVRIRGGRVLGKGAAWCKEVAAGDRDLCVCLCVYACIDSPVCMCRCHCA